MTFRLKVVAICMAVTAVVVSIAGLALVRAVSNDLRSGLDRDLQQVSRNFTPQIVNGLATDAVNLERREGLLGGMPTRGTFRREIVFVLGDVPDVAVADGVGFDTIVLGDFEARRFTRAVRSARGDAFVEVFAPLRPIEERIGFLRNRAIVVGLIAVAVAGFLAALLGRAVTGPLRELGRAAQSIRGTDDLDQRITLGSSTREIDDVAAVLNEMLDRLESESGRTRQSLEAARAFASDATHELRTPLTALANNVEILLRHPELSSEQRQEILEEISERQAAVTQVLGALRDLARGDLPIADDWELVDLGDVVESAIAAMPTDSAVTVEMVGDGVHLVHGWPDGLGILVDNLLSNASAHGRALDGRARIEVTIGSDAGADSARPGHLGVRLGVADSGPGIAPADVERLQRRYERGENSSRGMGLGLAMVRQQADLHRATLSFGTSRFGGAEVTIRFPAPPRTG